MPAAILLCPSRWWPISVIVCDAFADKHLQWCSGRSALKLTGHLAAAERLCDDKNGRRKNIFCIESSKVSRACGLDIQPIHLSANSSFLSTVYSLLEAWIRQRRALVRRHAARFEFALKFRTSFHSKSAWRRQELTQAGRKIDGTTVVAGYLGTAIYHLMTGYTYGGWIRASIFCTADHIIL